MPDIVLETRLKAVNRKNLLLCGAYYAEGETENKKNQ